MLSEARERGLVAELSEVGAVERALATPGAVIATLDVIPARLGVADLIVLRTLRQLQRAGHRPIVVLRATAALTGDRDTPRSELAAAVQAGLHDLRGQLARVLDLDHPDTGARLVLDSERVEPVSYLELLRDVGKYLTVNFLMTRPGLASTPELTYAQLCQFLIDAYGLAAAAHAHAGRLVIGPAGALDRVTATRELARRMRGDDLATLTCSALPERLLRVAEEGHIDLDPSRTQPYRFYQYWLNVSDTDVGPLLRAFSDRPLAELDELVRAHDADRARRLAQRELAVTLTDWIHGEPARASAEIAGRVMFGGTLEGLRDSDLAGLAGIVPTLEVSRAELEAGIGLVDLLARGFGDSKGAVRKLIAGGGAYVNNVQVKEIARTITLADLATETMLVIGSGRKNRRLVRVV
jgi:tyrosyl-tRNA synthetase